MLKLVVTAECDVEDIEDAKEKFLAIKSVFDVYEYVNVKGCIEGNIFESLKGGD